MLARICVCVCKCVPLKIYFTYAMKKKKNKHLPANVTLDVYSGTKTKIEIKGDANKVVVFTKK